MRAALAGLTLATALAGCGIYHVAPPRPAAVASPVTEDAAAAASNCFEAATAVEHAICADPALLAANRTMLRAYQSGLAAAGLFARDALQASQRAWLLDMPTRCGTAAPCLATALFERTRVLAAWRPPPRADAAWAAYVQFRPLAAPGHDPALCAALAVGADAALRRTGALEPALWGAAALAGTHGAAVATVDGHALAVAQHAANVYGLYRTRARSLAIDGADAITPLSLSDAVQQAETRNQGGRFSSFASQTGDYGTLDVFRWRNALWVLAADPWGFDTPAAPGEYAHAALWTLNGTTPALACLWNIYERPPDLDRFDALPAFGAWRAALAALRQATDLALGPAPLRDAAELRADTAFTLLNAPLVAIAEARHDGWTMWLRHRHDTVLDALAAWARRRPESAALVAPVLHAMRPAAQALLAAYQQMQGLSADEARTATAVAIMELLYDASTTLAPTLGAGLDAPAAPAAPPRYPILAEPS